MNAHPKRRNEAKIDSAPALIEAATRTYSRMNRVAIHVQPDMRLRLRGELCLVDRVLDIAENEINAAARAALRVVPRRHALPPPRKRLKGGTP
jgi:hypothetical protein